jgi:hypothetical protein
VRYFLTGRQPPVSAVLLVESGSRGIIERLMPGLQKSWCAGARIDLVSCYASLPQGFPEQTKLYRVADYRGRAGRKNLYRILAKTGYSHLGIVCSEEPLMTKWKWSLAARLPVKVFVVNENADYFWLDRNHISNMWEFALLRAGLAGAGAVRTIVRVVSFPFTLAYLLMFAGYVHARRALRRSAA